MPSASTRTSTSATNIILRFTWKPAHTSGSATRKLCGLKNALRTSWNACTGRPPGSVYSLLERRDLREVQVEPLRLELRDRPVLRQRPDRTADHRRQLRVLLEHGAVLLLRHDLAGDRPVRGRLRLLLQRDDRDVEDERLAATDLHRRERRGRRLVDERLLQRLEPRLDVVEPGRVDLSAGLHLLEVGEALGSARVLRDQHTLVRVQVRSREVDRPLAGGGDRRLLEGDVEVLRARREELRPRRVDVLHRRDAELLRDRLREVDLVALRVLDRASADRADREADGRVAEA